MQKGCSLINVYRTGVVNDQMYSVFFLLLLRKVTARNAIISFLSLLMKKTEQSLTAAVLLPRRQELRRSSGLEVNALHHHHSVLNDLNCSAGMVKIPFFLMRQNLFTTLINVVEGNLTALIYNQL